MNTRPEKSSSAHITKKLQNKSAVLPIFHKNEMTLYPAPLGEGNYATVYKATWQGKTVAVKKMLRKPVTDAICENEKKIMAIVADCQGKQPNLYVINCYGYKKTSQNYYLILDYASNGTVDDFLEKYTDISNLHYKISKDTAEGLDYLHSVCKIVHGDMKPANLLLDADMNVKISDYGFSLRIKTKTTLCLGSPEYMAPELLSEDEKGMTPYSPASDVYAFGVILYDIFVGEAPYPGMKPDEIFEKSIKNERPTIPEICPVKNLITKCWDQAPSKRPSSKELIVETEDYCKQAFN